ncbi:MAG: putative two-component system sensor kinase [Bryobacterales bacterium]|nr:putative two-component system sensor kinase [Bryobacterales bacterium]
MHRNVLRRAGPAAGLLLLATLGLPQTAFGLDPNRGLTQYVHRIWQSQQGLPQGAIVQIFQTRQGYLWLATQTGLVRFDGVRFQQVEDIIPGAPANLWIRAALEDQRGALWLGSSESGIYRLEPDGVKQFTTAQGLPSNAIQCLAPARDGVIWVCTESGLARMDVSSGEPRIEAVHPESGFTIENVRAACSDSSGNLWVGGDGPRLEVQSDGRFTSRMLKGIPGSASVRALLCAGDTIWAGTSDGLIRIRGNEQHLFGVKDGVADNFVFSLAQGSAGSIWIGTRNGFSRLRDGNLDSFRPQDGLSQSTAIAVFEDREGTLWVGTKRGLNQFVDGRGVPYTISEGLPSNEAGPVLEDHTGVVWAGTLDSGLARFDGQGFQSLNTRDGLASNTVYALAEDRGGSLWVGTQNGLNQLRDGHVVETYTVRRGLPGNLIRALYQARAGVLWAGTQNGLAVFRGGRFETAPGSPRDAVVALSENREGHIVLATERGVFEGVAGGFREITFNGSAIRPVNTLYRDMDGLLWMGLNGGGLRLLNGTEITSFQNRDGLYDGEIYGIVRDDQDRLWMACSRGIFSVPRSELRQFAAGGLKKFSSFTYSPTDAQRVIEGQSGVAPVLSRTHDGRLWFATIRGLIVLDPNHWQREVTPPLVVIENPIVNGRREPPNRIGLLPPGQKNIEFNYAGLAYYLPARLRFRYMLEGYDRDWIDAGNRREAFYTNLPPGNFRFRVTACNADNVCTEQGATVAFSLASYIYQRAWFWPLVAAMIAALGWLVYQLHIRRLRERYDLILAERSRIARELHDTLIQGFSGITMAMHALAGRLRSPQERETLEDIIRDAATCLRETRQSVAGLRAARDAESGLTAAIGSAAREITDTKDVRLKLKLEKGLRKLPAEVEYNLLRIASEAVSNSVKHSGARNIEVALESTPEAVHLKVHDDGSGLGKDGAALRPGHYGIIGMKERATQIGADLKLLSEPGNGTTVSVLLPTARTIVAHVEKTEKEKAETLS